MHKKTKGLILQFIETHYLPVHRVLISKIRNLLPRYLLLIRVRENAEQRRVSNHDSNIFSLSLIESTDDLYPQTGCVRYWPSERNPEIKYVDILVTIGGETCFEHFNMTILQLEKVSAVVLRRVGWRFKWVHFNILAFELTIFMWTL